MGDRPGYPEMFPAEAMLQTSDARGLGAQGPRRTRKFARWVGELPTGPKNRRLAMFSVSCVREAALSVIRFSPKGDSRADRMVLESLGLWSVAGSSPFIVHIPQASCRSHPPAVGDRLTVCGLWSVVHRPRFSVSRAADSG